MSAFKTFCWRNDALNMIYQRSRISNDTNFAEGISRIFFTAILWLLEVCISPLQHGRGLIETDVPTIGVIVVVVAFVAL